MIAWSKVGAVWVGVPDDSGTIRGVRCYLIDLDWTKKHIPCVTLRAIREDGSAEEVELDEGRYPNEAIDHLQKRAEVHYEAR